MTPHSPHDKRRDERRTSQRGERRKWVRSLLKTLLSIFSSQEKRYLSHVRFCSHPDFALVVGETEKSSGAMVTYELLLVHSRTHRVKTVAMREQVQKRRKKTCPLPQLYYSFSKNKQCAFLASIFMLSCTTQRTWACMSYETQIHANMYTCWA